MSVSGPRPRVVIADDYPELVVALRRLLESSCDVIGCASTGLQAVDAATTLKPDIIVVDLSMPDVNGLEVCRLIKQGSPDTDVVLLTALDDSGLQTSAFEAGAAAFIPKRAASQLGTTIAELFAKRGGK